MKNIFILTALCIIVIQTLVYGAQSDIITIADFNSGKRVNNLGAEFGCWQVDPKDKTQGCAMKFGETVAPPPGQKNYFLILNYDVQSPNPSYNGFWMKLGNLDLTKHAYFVFKVKGEKIFTSRFKVELKNEKGERVVYLVKDVTDRWQTITVPLEKVKCSTCITDWSKMTELSITFDDILATQKEGAICIDDLKFAIVKTADIN
ncbi:MAG: carbohydrate binding domain-containing protein [Candidatus Omnitrophota bacterium]